MDARIAQWADEGEAFLRNRFFGNDLQFNTSWSVEDRTITLYVHRVTAELAAAPLRLMVRKEEFLFEETCKAENFVSHLMVTKILMVM